MKALVLFLFSLSLVPAQTPNSIQASGASTRNVKPDMAQLSFGVVTQATTAQAAADQNATIADAMIKALQGVLGTSGTIETVYYSVSPRYSNSNPPALSGYTVNNTVRVIVNDVGRVGKLIDTATANGANSISGPTFGLQNPEPETQLALAAAAKQALAHAAAIASGLGGRTGATLSAQETATVTPIVTGGPSATGISTPVETGTVSVSARVTVTVALVQ